MIVLVCGIRKVGLQRCSVGIDNQLGLRTRVAGTKPPQAAVMLLGIYLAINCINYEGKRVIDTID